EASGGPCGVESSSLSARDQQPISPSARRQPPEFPAQRTPKFPRPSSSNSVTVRHGRGNRCSRSPPPVAAKRSDKRARFYDRVASQTLVLSPAFAAIRPLGPSTP